MKIILFKNISSTQDFSIDFISNTKLTEPVFIVAQNQTSGRGRLRNRVWISDNGNFHGSLCINIQKELGILENNILSLNEIVMKSLFNLLKKITKCNFLKLKLPNDIYINNKKLAGVLIEVFYPLAIIGIGINLVYSPLENSTNIRQFCNINISALDKSFIEVIYKEIINYNKYNLQN